MGLETITAGSNSTIADLNSDWPLAADVVSQGDNHIQNIKRALELTFPNVDATITASAKEIGIAHAGGTISGALVVLDALSVVGISTFKDEVSISGSLNVALTLSVDGKATFKDALSVSGAAVCGSLSVVGATVLKGALSTDAAVHVGTTLSVSGAALMLSTLTVKGALSTDAAVHVGTTLTVSGKATVATFNAQGQASCSTGLTVKGALTAESTLIVKGDMSVSGSAVIGDLEINRNAYFTSLVSNGTLSSTVSATIDWGLGNKQAIALDGTGLELLFVNPDGPTSVTLKITHTSASTVSTWDAAVKWPGGTPPTLATGVSDIDIISFFFDGVSYYGASGIDYS